MVQEFGRERFEFILNETQTHQILEDVKNRFCDLGILYLCGRNEAFLRKTMDEMGCASRNCSPPLRMPFSGPSIP